VRPGKSVGFNATVAGTESVSSTVSALPFNFISSPFLNLMTSDILTKNSIVFQVGKSK
jgi:hypothetical protein